MIIELLSYDISHSVDHCMGDGSPRIFIFSLMF